MSWGVSDVGSNEGNRREMQGIEGNRREMKKKEGTNLIYCEQMCSFNEDSIFFLMAKWIHELIRNYEIYKYINQNKITSHPTFG